MKDNKHGGQNNDKTEKVNSMFVAKHLVKRAVGNIQRMLVNSAACGC